MVTEQVLPTIKCRAGAESVGQTAQNLVPAEHRGSLVFSWTYCLWHLMLPSLRCKTGERRVLNQEGKMLQRPWWKEIGRSWCWWSLLLCVQLQLQRLIWLLANIYFKNSGKIILKAWCFSDTVDHLWCWLSLSLSPPLSTNVNPPNLHFRVPMVWIQEAGPDAFNQILPSISLAQATNTAGSLSQPLRHPDQNFWSGLGPTPPSRSKSVPPFTACPCN